MRVLLIHNPKAGDRKHSRKQLLTLLTKSGHQAMYQSTKKRGWKKAFKKPVDLVIAAGGDGTVQKTAWQIMDSGIPFAILPLGTANNLARSLGFNAPVEEIVQSLHCGKSHSMSAWRVAHRRQNISWRRREADYLLTIFPRQRRGKKRELPRRNN